MKNLVIVIFLFGSFIFVNAQTIGYLTLGDSTEIFYPQNNEWVQIFLTDSTGTSDTAVIELYNSWSAKWTPILVRDDSSGTQSTLLIPPVSNVGRHYTVWLPYPGTMRIRRIDSVTLSDKLYYYLYTRGR